MAEQMSLDNILDDNAKPDVPAPVAPAADAPAPEPAAAGEKPDAAADPGYRSRKSVAQEKEFNAQGLERDPTTGQFTKRTEAAAVPGAPAAAVAAPAVPAAPSAPAAEQMTPKEMAFFRAAHDERTKRQELERRLAALEKPAEPAKTFWEDPEAALKASEERVQGAIAQTRISTSETIARSRYADFDEKISEFGKLAQANPWLAHQCQQAPDPAEFAYKAGKSHQELANAGGMDAWRASETAKIRAEERAKVEAELKAKADALERDRAALPRSLSDARGIPGNKPVWSGPTSLDNILKR